MCAASASARSARRWWRSPVAPHIIDKGIPTAVLVLSGVDSKPLAVYGPFIMKTRRELEQAFDRYHKGEMGRVSPLPQA
jgi:redox-sensitive bicupin YhaK (pirin superfamily)